MPKNPGSEKTKVNGGWVTREAPSGRLVAVQTDEGSAKASPKSASVLEQASSKRGEALKRLAKR